jgi:hypothetical protein
LRSGAAGGAQRRRCATYDLPTSGIVSCPGGISTLAPGQTWTVDQFLPLTASGQVTLTIGARFFVIATATDGARQLTGSPGPFAHRWPALQLSVAPAVPAGHTISLQQINLLLVHQVSVAAPTAALRELYYIENVTCQSGQGGTEEPNLTW